MEDIKSDQRIHICCLSGASIQSSCPATMGKPTILCSGECSLTDQTYAMVSWVDSVEKVRASCHVLSE